MSDKTTIYAYLAQAASAGIPGFGKTTVIEASDEAMKAKIRTETRCGDAEVIIVPPEEWNPPQFKAVSQADITGNFPTVMSRVIAHMAKHGLPNKDPNDLIRNGTIMPNRVSGKIYFVYKT